VPVPANPVTGLIARKAKLLAELEATKAAQEHVTFLANSLIILDRIYRENEGSEEIRLAAQQATAALTALIDALDRSP
jgi:hypothetical protein